MPQAGIAAISYGICGGAYALLGARLFWQRRAGALAWCSAVTACWALIMAWQGFPALAHAAEGIRTAAWLACISVMVDDRLRRPGMRVALLAVSVLDAASTLCRLVLAVLGLLVTERLYRDTAERERWTVKFICFGVGALFAYDFYLYSDALLFRRVNGEIWSARGLVNAFSVPLLWIAAARSPGEAPGLRMSRRLMFGSVTLLGASVYLLTMAASAWYLRYVGGAWGPFMQLACLSGAMLLLVVALLSGTLRARIKVMVNKHFYRDRFDYREEWMRLTRALSEPGPDLPARCVRALAALVESPAGALWIRRGPGRYMLTARWNVSSLCAGQSADGPMCGLMEARQWVIDVAQCERDPQSYDGLAVPEWLRAVPDIWLAVPLMLNGEMFGIVCLTRSRAPVALNWELIDVLKIAGSQAASYLAWRDSADSLSVARQFESLNRMSAFVVHDLKNLVSQLSLLLLNAAKHHANPAFQADMRETIANSVEKMKLLLTRLRQRDLPGDVLAVPLDAVLERTVQFHAIRSPAPQLEVHERGLVVRADVQRLERVLGHIIQNASEATPPTGQVAVLLAREGDYALVEIRDTGEGMSEDFIRNRLFKPFESTKASGMGIGMFESREYIHELDGRLDVVSAPGQGTTFRIRFPLHQEELHG